MVIKQVGLSLVFAGLFFADSVSKPAPAPAVQVTDHNLDARRIPYRLGQSPIVFVQKDWNTILLLPKDERILDVRCGQKLDWDIYSPANVNFVQIQPLRKSTKAEPLSTNLILVTASGNIYSIALKEVSDSPNEHADTQAILEVADTSMQAAIDNKPKYVLSTEAEAFRSQAEKAEKQLVAQQAETNKRIEEVKQDAAAATPVMHSYEYDKARASKNPFGVISIYHTDKFTFIEAQPTTMFAVYGISDGKPEAVNITPDGEHVFRLDRVLDKGYLQVGKKNRIEFKLPAQSANAPLVPVTE